MLQKLKRDLITVLFMLQFILHLLKKQYATALGFIAKIELLESHISFAVSTFLFHLVKRKYTAAACSSSDPFIANSHSRFSSEGQRKFLAANAIFLKPYISQEEKGVLLLKYTEIINAFPFLFDLGKIQERYDLVLEPSWETPYQPYYKFYQDTGDVYVESLSDREIKEDARHGFVPVPISAADWLKETSFVRSGVANPVYDLCFIANFLPFKRHEYLFAALRDHWKGNLKIALIASVHVGESKDWIERLISKYGLQGKVDLFLEVPQQKVNEILNQSRCHVLCSMREGANKANFESMFVGTPVVVHEDHIGFPNFRFRYPMVVNYTNQKDLVVAIKKCAEIHRDEVYSMAQSMIGSCRATEILNEILKKRAVEKGKKWTMDLLRKVNIVHCFYFNPEDALKCQKDFEFLESVSKFNDCYSRELAIKRFIGEQRQ